MPQAGPELLLQPNRRKTFESLISRIDLDTHGFQRGNTQNWLDPVLPKNDGRAHHFTHEFNSGYAGLHDDFCSIGQFVSSFSPWLDANGTQMISWGHAINCPGINEKQPFP